MKKLILFSLLLLLVGCASPKFNYSPAEVFTALPENNSVITAYVGDTLVEQKTLVIHDAIELKAPVHLSLDAYIIPAGIYRKLGEDEIKKADVYSPTSEADEKIILGKFVAPAVAILAGKDENELCVVRAEGTCHCTDADFTPTTVRYLSKNSFQQALLYSGKVGDKLNISYREFSNNHARQAFTHNVEYDLNESKIIGYKGALIEIIEATNNHVTYRVLNNFKTRRMSEL